MFDGCLGREAAVELHTFAHWALAPGPAVPKAYSDVF